MSHDNNPPTDEWMAPVRITEETVHKAYTPPLIISMNHAVKVQHTLEWYRLQAARTLLADKPFMLGIAGLGLAGESGEVVDLIKKFVGHGHKLPREELIKELGDVLWYLSAICTLTGTTLDEVATANIEKLQARYPEGFSNEASQNRKV